MRNDARMPRLRPRNPDPSRPAAPSLAAEEDEDAVSRRRAATVALSWALDGPEAATMRKDRVGTATGASDSAEPVGGGATTDATVSADGARCSDGLRTIRPAVVVAISVSVMTVLAKPTTRRGSIARCAPGILDAMIVRGFHTMRPSFLDGGRRHQASQHPSATASLGVRRRPGDRVCCRPRPIDAEARIAGLKPHDAWMPSERSAQGSDRADSAECADRGVTTARDGSSARRTDTLPVDRSRPATAIRS